VKRSRTTPMTSGSEYDAFSKRARRALCVFFNNTGLVKYWQRVYNKRDRKIAKRGLTELDSSGNLLSEVDDD
jgi:hypothetical protein